MKQLFYIYTFIGILLSPFIYINNAGSYFYSNDYATGIGRSLGGAFYWPSYLFSIEPTLDGSSYENFSKSMESIIDYRRNKFFSQGKVFETNGGLLFVSLFSLCVVSKDPIIKDAENVYSDSTIKKLKIANNNSLDLESIINSDSFKATLEGMDGYDFSDIVSCGLDFQDRAIDDLRKITLNSSDRESIQAFIWMLKSL